MTTNPNEEERTMDGHAVVITRGQYRNEPAMVLSTYPRTLDVLLGRTGELVTVRRSSVEDYG